VTIRTKPTFQIAGVNVESVKIQSEEGAALGRIVWDDEDNRYLFDPLENWWFEASELRDVADAIDAMMKAKKEL
jgi:hypothetical protein